ncbi:hypothetical protein PENSUB_5208 [Penicillium subrubescens]|uniref:Uncharacterized protein n=1 Tax=Penicillium subrubescens TaxID=1316194 RepID=A0A1Q5UQZ1_9EURO|nr:hypothetical protein PENSUB_5208 [Penicillium subrubescens]
MTDPTCMFAPSQRYHSTANPPGASVNLGIWTVLEGSIIIIAACLPSTWPLIVRILPRGLMGKAFSQNHSRHRYPTKHAKPKGADGFSRLGKHATGTTDKWPLAANPSLENQSVSLSTHTLDPTLVNAESISLRSMNEIREEPRFS